ncbi:MAG: hypothetical protein IJY74_05940 [Oscillospiraceae bacterium]|nr:hypothetical protein [Oscillospiraceae bacterium]
MQKKTLLGFLMEQKWVSENEIFELIGADPEVFRSWYTKKGISSADVSSEEKLAEVFFDKMPYRELVSILEKISPGSIKLDEEAQKEILGKALGMEWTEGTAKNQAKERSQSVPIKIYLPQCNEKIPSAVKAFWEVVAGSDVSGDIYITDWGILAFDEMDTAMFQYMAEQMFRAAKRGFSIHILTPEAEEYPDGSVLLRRLPLYLNGSVTYYRMPGGTEYPANECWMVFGIKAVMLTRMLPGEAPVTTLIQETTLSQYYSSWMQLLLVQTRPLNHHVGENDTVQIYTRMKSDVHPLMTVYFLESAPSFFHMPPQLLREVMTENGAEEAQISECLRISMLRASIRSICKCAQIYNGDQILHLLQQDKYTDPMLSGILGKPAYITSEQLKKQLRFFLSETDHTNYQMFLPSFETDLRLSQCGASMAVQEDSFMTVMDLTNRNRNFYSTDLSCTGGFAQYMEQLHRMIPPVKRSGSWTKRLIKRYISL